MGMTCSINASTIFAFRSRHLTAEHPYLVPVGDEDVAAGGSNTIPLGPRPTGMVAVTMLAAGLITDTVLAPISDLDITTGGADRNLPRKVADGDG
jgi:hypothetical protein